MNVGPFKVELFEDGNIRSIFVKDGNDRVVSVCNTHDRCEQDTRELNIDYLFRPYSIDREPRLLEHRDAIVQAYDALHVATTRR